jgi:hypothetical protein
MPNPVTNHSGTTPYSLRASASLHMEEYTCNSEGRNLQKLQNLRGLAWEFKQQRIRLRSKCRRSALARFATKVVARPPLL